MIGSATAEIAAGVVAGLDAPCTLAIIEGLCGGTALTAVSIDLSRSPLHPHENIILSFFIVNLMNYNNYRIKLFIYY